MYTLLQQQQQQQQKQEHEQQHLLLLGYKCLLGPPMVPQLVYKLMGLIITGASFAFESVPNKHWQS
jgi:hypothetical protein